MTPPEHRYSATIRWARDGAPFLDHRYSRRHLLQFDGGIDVVGSSSPLSVPLPYSEAAAVDPEEAFVASLSSCHMLWFLALAAKRQWCVDSYIDQAHGVMQKNANGKLFVSAVTLRPAVTFSGAHLPSNDEIVVLHHEAHTECYIANSVLTEVHCEPVFANPTDRSA